MPQGLPTTSAPTAPVGGGIPRIRRPRKIIFVVLFLAVIYYFSLRHGLGSERAIEHLESLRRQQQYQKVHPPVHVGAQVKPLGGGRGASGLWHSFMASIGLGGGRVKQEKPKAQRHEFGKDGLVVVGRETVETEHPIYDLIDKARLKFDNLLSRQSKTLSEAVTEYKRRYGMPPPRGYDAWWKFVLENDIKIVDDYDRIMADIYPYHALSPPMFRARVDAQKTRDFTYMMNITADGVTLDGDRAEASRPKSLKAMIDGFRYALPEDFETEIVGSDHDLGAVILGWDQRERAQELIEDGQYFTEQELKDLQNVHRTEIAGWFSACRPNSPANAIPDAQNVSDAGLPKTFIHDHSPTMDFCQHPSLKKLHGAMSLDYLDRSPSELRPLFVLSKYITDSEFLQTAIQGFKNQSDLKPSDTIPWEEKTESKLFWRGSSTGGFDKKIPWEWSHRMRLHFMINGEKGNEDEMKHDLKQVMVPDGKDGFAIEQVDRWTLNKAYMDVGLAGKPMQCQSNHLCEDIEAKVKFSPYVPPDTGGRYKCNGWSQRYARLLSSGSVVLKMTMFPEWYQDWISEFSLACARLLRNAEALAMQAPWLHYIPVKASYEDLYDIMAFFAGPVKADGEIDESLGHDYLAKEIAENGQEFVKEHWRWEVMQAYMFRLLLE
ncbi:hypothetical protein QFC22_001826 [Naganishia vaughanmartiniae]|uniref:Uncharacterized protein n=1 Tax=Naganishia vaughanmartiniae TaxID=1424756 RepID=A0ACC2XFI3_9TREE|nr:hypothetical protein QFC22_001826 [Naganishia vaughanmartiniae]